MIRDENFKLIHYYVDDRLELYDLKNDIKEENDLSDKLPGKRKELLTKLNNLLQKNNASLPVKLNPGYEGDL